MVTVIISQPIVCPYLKLNPQIYLGPLIPTIFKAYMFFKEFRNLEEIYSQEHVLQGSYNNLTRIKTNFSL